MNIFKKDRQPQLATKSAPLPLENGQATIERLRELTDEIKHVVGAGQPAVMPISQRR